MAHVIDLRSDTVTLPTPEMLRAMASAELGDDGYGEDPTVNHLQELAAERMGKEAALFVSSGTMGNLVGILSHCHQGEEVIVGDQTHVVLGEVAGLAVIGGLQFRTVPNRDGVPSFEDVESAIRAPGAAYPRTGVITLENTHGLCGGIPVDGTTLARFADLAHRSGAALHVDGARVFNAAVAFGVDVRELVGSVDSVAFCLSKGLSAPVGSLLCGGKEYIARARRWRRMLGGQMRQVGGLAAAGIVALETMVDRLAEDHENARVLAEGLAGIPGLVLYPSQIRTNIVYCDVTHPSIDARQFHAQMAAEGVRFHPTKVRRVRMVTHYGITAEDIQTTLAVARKVMAG